MHRRAARTLVAALAATLLVPAAAGASHTVESAPEGADTALVVKNAPALTTTCDPRSGTATEGADFDGAPVPVVAGSAEIPLREDDVHEGDETVVVDCGGHAAEGIITDNDAPPALSVADVSVAEDEGPAKVTISASRASSKAVTIPLSAASASAGGADFTAPSQVTLPAGATSVDAEVAIANDREDEVDETFSLLLGTPSNATVADGEGVVTIVNDDLRVVDVFDVSAAEGDGGTSVARFAIRLDAPTFRTVTVAFTTFDGSARAPGDYLSRLGTATIPPGQTAAFVEVQIAGDRDAEGTEVFGLGLTGVDGARLGDNVGLGIVIDDDDDQAGAGAGDVRPPQMSLNGPRARGGAVTVRVSCPAAERSCAGRVALFTVADKRSRARTLRRERRIGRKSFRLRGGRSTTVSVPVPRSLLAAARRARRLKVQAFVLTEDAAGNVDTRTVRATLRYRARRST